MIENDIKQQLFTDGVEQLANIAIGAMPSTPDNVIVITTADSILTSQFNTLTNQALIPPGITDIQQTITITVRNTDYATGQSKIWNAYNKLVATEYVGGQWIPRESGYKVCNNRQMFISAAQPPHYSTTDGSNRIIFVFNFVANTSRDS